MAAVSSVITVGLLGTPSLVVTLGLSPGVAPTVLAVTKSITLVGASESRVPLVGASESRVLLVGASESRITLQGK